MQKQNLSRKIAEMRLKILFLVPYPIGESPSQRFRFEQYLSMLKKNGNSYTIQSFLDVNRWQLFFRNGKGLQKIFALMQGTAKRFFILLKVPSYDFVFIHREAMPIGPPVIEWLIARIFKKKIIYDFDDAIWLTDRRQESFFLRTVKWRDKIARLCVWAYKISCGNDYLCSFANSYNSQVVRNPTTIDTDHLHNPNLFPKFKNKDRVVIGWTGTHSTLKYLYAIEPVLQKIELEFPQVEVLVIADAVPALSLQSLTFIQWDKSTEIEDLLRADIGIMPLADDEWTKGKCGFKALQYMALEIPAVASPVGVNVAIIQHNQTGYLCTHHDDWYDALKRLICDPVTRSSFGIAGRKFVQENYSITSNASTFLNLFE